ncbi:hypothetical protein V7138_15020 [Bacillus sp. JJ1533]|uniref:hypothetical protein n=1 Tax=Bacillus sp. JJ1533 TaxID=3122959 RepID=UPI002FFE3C6D
MFVLEKLEVVVKELMDNIEEEYVLVSSLAQSHRAIVDKQEEKIRDTVRKLFPVMHVIKQKGYMFKGKDTDYMSARGPVLYHDTRESELYVFDVEQGMPVIVDLYNPKEKPKNITFRKLLEDVPFPQIMDSLLLVLTHHRFLQKDYQESIDELEAELNAYENIF